MRYYTSNDKYEIKNGKGYLKEGCFWYFDYHLKFEGEYLNGEKNGKGKEYNEEGELIFEGEYLNGKKWNGKIYEYHWNGIDRVIKLEKGKGSIKKYYSNGKLKLEYEYLNGEKNGIRKEYYENGQLEYEAPYLNGVKNGISEGYYDNGKLEYETPWCNKWKKKKI